jgi:hypothetical protein
MVQDSSQRHVPMVSQQEVWQPVRWQKLTLLLTDTHRSSSRHPRASQAAVLRRRQEQRGYHS